MSEQPDEIAKLHQTIHDLQVEVRLLQEAVGSLSPETTIFNAQGDLPSEETAWLFHLSARNVMATSWQPWLEGDQIVGFQVRLLEISGRRAKLKLSSFRPVSTAPCPAPDVPSRDLETARSLWLCPHRSGNVSGCVV